MAIRPISVMVLCGERLSNINTAATLIKAGINVVGICIINQHPFGIPVFYLQHSLRNYNIVRLANQIAGNLYYKLLNSRKDNLLYERIFNSKDIKNILADWNGPKFYTNNLSEEVTNRWLLSLNADIYIVNTSSWVPKSVRRLPRENIIIGGHPGLTPRYRGSHSAFWAIYNGRPEDVGCSIFWLDSGIDTGDLIQQERIEIEEDDSYLSLGWKGLKREAEMQADVILNYARGFKIPRKKHAKIPEGSNYGLPTLQEYIKYRRMQKIAR